MQLAVDIDALKKTIKALNDKKAKIENEKMELEFQLNKLRQEKQELEPKIQEIFGTTDKEALLAKLAELELEVGEIMQKAEAL